MKESVLFVFTKLFPFGKQEQYLVDELPYLAKKFDKVVFVPAEKFDKEISTMRRIPGNCEVLLINDEANKVKSVKKRNEFLSVFFSEWMNCRSKLWFWKEKRRYSSVLLHQQHLATVLKNIIDDRFKNVSLVFYAYWIHNSSIMLALMKRRGDINHFVCRGHSIDLYESDWALARYIKILPFYNFIIRNASHVFAISKHGSDYLKNRFPSMAEKFSYSRLGVSDLGINPFNAESKFTVVSCSNFSDNKRVTEIAKVILQMKTAVRWVHFGSGDGKEKVAEIVKEKPANVSVELRGFVPNEEIREFYRSETVNMVINLSEAEGIPVSLMEAISFGIPVLATAVYGNPEVANEQTGFSVPFQSKTENIASLLDNFAGDVALQKQKRISARKFFLSAFSATVNFSAFANELHNPKLI